MAIEPTGADTHVTGTVGSQTLAILLRQRLEARPGETIHVNLPATSHLFFDPESGMRVA